MGQDLKLCRLCAESCKNTTTTSLFDRSKKSALRRIFLLTNIQLKNLSNLPSIMCVDCENELERAYEFRNRCLSAHTYFSSPEYKSHFDHSHSQNHLNNSKENESSSMKVEVLPTESEFEIHSDINFKNVVQDAVKSEYEFEALNVGEVMNIMHDDGQVELETQSTEFATHKTLSWNKTRVNLEITKEKDRIEGIRMEEVIAQPIKSDDNEEDSQDDDNPKAKTKEARKNKARTYICDQCGNNFKYRSHFYSHIKRHTGVKPLQCEVCPHKFFTEGELKRHMRRHTGERPFPCQHCERRFTDYSTRIKHERTHTNERPFGCPQCGKAFTTSYVLKNHMLVHTGERSFKCTLCNKSFQRQTHLIVHTRSLIHKQNVERQQINRK